MKIIDKQNLWDLTLMATGHAEGIIAMAVANDKSITDDLVPGEAISTEGVAVLDPDVVEHYRRHQVRPATAVEPIATVKDPCNLCTYFK